MDPNMEKYSYASLDSLETKSVKLQHINKP